MARTNTIPQARKVDYRNIVCSGHARQVWRKQHSRDLNTRYRGKVKDFEWTLDELANQERAVDFDMAQQINDIVLVSPMYEIPVPTLFDEIRWDLEWSDLPREYHNGLDEEETFGEEDVFDQYYWYDDYDSSMFDYLEEIDDESEEEIKMRRAQFDNDPIHNFACPVTYGELSNYFGEHAPWENRGWSIRHMPKG